MDIFSIMEIISIMENKFIKYSKNFSNTGWLKSFESDTYNQ